MYIGKLAKLTGATPKAIRHYESIGLLRSVKRQGAYRTYTDEDVEVVRLIKLAQSAGFRLAELKATLGGSYELPNWQRIVYMIQQKMTEIEQEIGQMEKRRATLREYASEIEKCLRQNPDCRISYREIAKA